MRLIRFDALNERFGISWSRTHLDRLERAGRFPRRVRYGLNSIAWSEAEIEAWLNERAAARAMPKPAPRRARPRVTRRADAGASDPEPP